MKNCLLAHAVLVMLSVLPSTGHSQTTKVSDGVRIEQSGDKFAITIGDQLFTELHIGGFRRPILYPVMGPGQTPMTRNHPMKKNVEGEADDHPHHKSIWCAHGLINGVSFWHEQGEIVVDRSKPMSSSVSTDGASGTVSFHSNYLDADGKLVCTDKTTMTFHDLSNARAIDWDVTISASEVELLFGDTKEGMMAIRTHPSLRIDKGATGMNSLGDEGKGIWGKPAAWVDYSGKVEDKHVGVAIFDHPSNLRHPTTWHARAYGLVAANPFGLHHFQGKPEGSGDFKVEKDGSVRFRYRFVFHAGDAKSANVAELYKAFAKE